MTLFVRTWEADPTGEPGEIAPVWTTDVQFVGPTGNITRMQVAELDANNDPTTIICDTKAGFPAEATIGINTREGSRCDWTTDPPGTVALRIPSEEDAPRRVGLRMADDDTEPVELPPFPSPGERVGLAQTVELRPAGIGLPIGIPRPNPRTVAVVGTAVGIGTVDALLRSRR